MAVIERTVAETCAEAKAASRVLATLETQVKDRALGAIADALDARAGEIIAANAKDLDAGRGAGLEAALMDGLLLDEQRLSVIAEDVPPGALGIERTEQENAEGYAEKKAKESRAKEDS